MPINLPQIPVVRWVIFLIFGFPSLPGLSFTELWAAEWADCGSSHVAETPSAWRDLLSGFELSVFGRGPARAMIGEVEGAPQIVSGDQRPRSILTGQMILEGDEIRVPNDSSQKSAVNIWLSEGHNIKVLPGGRVRFHFYSSQPNGPLDKVEVQLVEGDVRCSPRRSEQPQSASRTLRLRTPTAVVGIRGTDFLLSYQVSEARTRLVVFAGQVEIAGLRPIGADFQAKENAPDSHLVGAGQVIEVLASPAAVPSASPQSISPSELNSIEKKNR